MVKLCIVLLVGLLPLLPAVLAFWQQREHAPSRAARGLVVGLTRFNFVLVLMAAAIGIIWLISPSTVMAFAGDAEEAASDPYVSLGAALSTGLAAIGAGIAVSSSGAAAVGAIAEKPEAFGRALLFVGLAEGIAIYGLIISFMILNQ